MAIKTPTNPAVNGQGGVFDAWTQMQVQMQKNLWDGWMDAAKTMSASNPYMNPYLEATEKWRELTEQSLQAWSSNMSGMSSSVPGANGATSNPAGSTAQSAAEGAIAGQNIMLQLLEMTSKAWQDLAPQMASGNWSDALMSYTQEVQSQWADAATSGFTETQSVMELWQAYLEESQNVMQLWTEPFKEMPSSMSLENVMSGNMMGLSNVFWDAFEKTVGRYASSPTLGYSRETNQKLLQSFDAWVNVQRTSADYSAQMATISGKAFSAIMEEMLSMSQKGESASSYQALIQKWITVADKVFVEEFRSPEYIRTQGKLLSATMMYRKREEALQEAFLESRGLPTRTEVDEAHQNIYELRKELRAVRRQLREVNAFLTQPAITDAPADAPTGDSSTPLPDDMPERDFLLAAGVGTLETVPTTEEELVALNGVGPARARRILEYLNDATNSTDEEGTADARSRAL